jgi:hypothetical protein
MKIRPRNRQKRCYELAWRYLCADERYGSGWSLVQGQITPKETGAPFGHAWLVSDAGRVYDPVKNLEYGRAEYETEFKAEAMLIYSLKEAGRLGAEFGHYGPWVWPPCGR